MSKFATVDKNVMEYLIFCDESLLKGQFFSHFYGGALVRSKDYEDVRKALEEKKQELNLFGEIKWTKVTANYLNKYLEMMDLYFKFIKEGKIKVRIMFQATEHEIEEHNDADKYHILYYQFIKHAFGLPYRDEYKDQDINLKLFFDEIPDTREQNDDFKAHICYLQELNLFKKAHIKIKTRTSILFSNVWISYWERWHSASTTYIWRYRKAQPNPGRRQ